MVNIFMEEALKYAKMAAENGEIPVGAVIVHNNEIIFAAHNLKETQHDPTAHAEILALKGAAKVLGDWRLKNCDIYVTLEPCPMCASAISQARTRRLYFGAFDPAFGGAGSYTNLLNGTEVYGGIMEQECTDILNRFFENRRR